MLSTPPQPTSPPAHTQHYFFSHSLAHAQPSPQSNPLSRESAAAAGRCRWRWVPRDATLRSRLSSLQSISARTQPPPTLPLPFAHNHHQYHFTINPPPGPSSRPARRPRLLRSPNLKRPRPALRHGRRNRRTPGPEGEEAHHSRLEAGEGAQGGATGGRKALALVAAFTRGGESRGRKGASFGVIRECDGS
jgi:hypothetical protein